MPNKIAMTPGEAPQQRIHIVVALPPRPRSFRSRCGKQVNNYSSYKELPIENRPTQMPRSAQFVGTAEWAWSPMHSRIDVYYISTNRKKSHWLLWKRWIDDSDYRWKWANALYGYGTKRDIPKKTAAIHLLIDAWDYEREFEELDHFHMLNTVELLSVAEFRAIGRVVWDQE